MAESPNPSGPLDAPARPSDARPGRGGFRGGLGNLALLLASVTLVLGVAEAATRGLSRIGPALLVADPVVGKRYVAGYEGRVFVDEAGHEVDLRFNREGFRGPDRPRRRPPGGHRIAVIGDSMIVAVATNEEETLVARLEAALQTRHRNQPVEVMNFGVSSSSTGQELALYRHRVAAYDPDVVVLAFFVGNDFADSSRRLTRAPRIYFDLDADGQPRQVSAPSAPGAMARWLNLHSRFYVWQKKALRHLRGSARSAAGALPPGVRIFEVSDDPDLAHAWSLLEALLGRFKADVEANGSRFLLVIVPSAEQIRDALWTEIEALASREGIRLDRGQPGRRLARIAREGGIELVDLTPSFRQAAAGAPETALFLLGRYHLSDRGHRLAATEILGALAPPEE